MNSNVIKPRAEILPLTGIRALAAWWVVMYHTAYILPPQLVGLYWFARLGDKGVDLFFVLSGFVISYNYWQRLSAFSINSYLSFLWVRLARLYPVHLFTLIVSLLFLTCVRVFHLATPKDFSGWTLGNFLANVALVHSWPPYPTDSWNNASWSVSCEWFAYLAFPLLVLIGLKRLALPVAAICAVLFSAIPVALVLAKCDPPFGALILVICEFTAGCLVYHVYSRWREHARFRWLLLFGVFAAFTLLLIFGWAFPDIFHISLVLVFPFVIFEVAESSGVFARLLGSRMVVYWGRVSYSLYMT
ncbi:MAG: acyltransferase, partial [Terracidiphilus sp.]